MFNQGGGGLPSVFVNGRWWILVVFAGGGGRLSRVVLDLHRWKGVPVDGSGGDSSPFSQVDVVPPSPRAIEGVHECGICLVAGVAGRSSSRVGARGVVSTGERL
jgi:hypothetical protein